MALFFEVFDKAAFKYFAHEDVAFFNSVDEREPVGFIVGKFSQGCMFGDEFLFCEVFQVFHYGFGVKVGLSA